MPQSRRLPVNRQRRRGINKGDRTPRPGDAQRSCRANQAAANNGNVYLEVRALCMCHPVSPGPPTRFEPFYAMPPPFYAERP